MYREQKACTWCVGCSPLSASCSNPGFWLCALSSCLLTTTLQFLLTPCHRLLARCVKKNKSIFLSRLPIFLWYEHSWLQSEHGTTFPDVSKGEMYLRVCDLELFHLTADSYYTFLWVMTIRVVTLLQHVWLCNSLPLSKWNWGSLHFSPLLFYLSLSDTTRMENIYQKIGFALKSDAATLTVKGRGCVRFWLVWCFSAGGLSHIYSLHNQNFTFEMQKN